MTRKLIIISFLFLVTLHLQALPASELQDSTRVQSLLVIDTVGLRISGPSNDVTFYMNGIIFLSNSKYHQKMIPDHISFGTVKAYFVPLDYMTLESSRPLFPNDDFPYSPAGMSFTRDYQTVYFTKPVELAGRRSVEKIFEMSVVDGKASAYRQLPFTTDPSRYMQPAISQDDSILVFSSDRTPSSGGLDLFVSRRTAAGWSVPTNLGRGINTSGHERFPFLDHNNNLYFSSSGHLGYGGFDIYVCLWDGAGWGNPLNLTQYINTPGDELGFSIHPNNKIAVFNRIIEAGTSGEILTVSLDERTFSLSGTGDSQRQDICLLFKDMAISGYTSGQFQAAAGQTPIQAFNLKAMPLLTEKETTDKAEPDQIKITPVTQAGSSTSRQRLDAPKTAASGEPDEQGGSGTTQKVAVSQVIPAVPETAGEPDPNRLNFRVQILSSTKPHSRPQVTVDGKIYSTFEYYHKGAYRITVGEFPTVQEANAFRAKCKSSGFNQSFVAAFRGEVRETDSSVFRQR